MPIYEYIAKDTDKSCKYCQNGFSIKQSLSEDTLLKCPKCKADIRKIFPVFTIGASKTSLDRRAKDNGFHKLKKVDKGKYEKIY